MGELELELIGNYCLCVIESNKKPVTEVMQNHYYYMAPISVLGNNLST